MVCIVAGLFESGLQLQLAHPLLKAAGRSSVIMMSSVAGGPTTVQSGTIYAMTKGVQAVSGRTVWVIMAKH